ncbi:MAG TPA: MaoC family dehydratase [Dehalococcoidia bacterium]|jgi:acyl dehydratase|nr:MaoC family dehydratase [Dehalococcoidia bacterium]
MDPEPGATAERSMLVTPDIVAAYAALTGDYNPLHFDEAFVAQTRFGRLMAQGGIATGLLHALVAMDLPGPGSVFTKQEWSFPRPVYIGDTITAQGTITSARPSRGFYQMRFVVKNQDGDDVLTGESTVFRDRPKA